MEFETWAPIYKRIVQDLGYDSEADRRARDVLADLRTSFAVGHLNFEDQTVAIAGGSNTLETNLQAVQAADRVIAVSNAAGVLRANGIPFDLAITDLDKIPTTMVSLSTEGVPVGVHAHGDNIPAVKQYGPQFEPEYLFGTTQVEPTDEVFNFGGFTDGDRAAFLADHFGAETLTFPGWKFDDQTVSSEKNRKLMWAARLLRCLERQRGERFPILDGWRTDLEDFPDGETWTCV